MLDVGCCSDEAAGVGIMYLAGHGRSARPDGPRGELRGTWRGLRPPPQFQATLIWSGEAHGNFEPSISHIDEGSLSICKCLLIVRGWFLLFSLDIFGDFVATMAIHMPWTRLIRFVSAEDNLVYFGDAMAPGKGFDVGAKENADTLRAKVIQGNPLSPDCVVLDTTLRVKRLLSPLSRDMVPALRCIGGNYMSHSTFAWINSIAPPLIRLSSQGTWNHSSEISGPVCQVSQCSSGLRRRYRDSQIDSGQSG
jgi:hypothetical protein